MCSVGVGSGRRCRPRAASQPMISALDTVRYYESVRKAQGSQASTDEFFRLFMVPGMGHCGGGPGANVFGNAGNASPTADAGSDLLMGTRAMRVLMSMARRRSCTDTKLETT